MPISEKTAIPRTENSTPRYDLLSAAELETLADSHSKEPPVVSLYLDVPPMERKRDELRAKINHFADEQARRLESESRHKWHAFQDIAGRILQWLDDEYDETGRGLAILASDEKELWRVFRLSRPIRDQMVVSDRPYLRPLFTLLDEYERYMVILIDKQKARLFSVYMAEIEEHDELEDELVPNPRSGGGEAADKHQRHHEMHVLWHVKHTIQAAERLWQRDKPEWLVIGGTDEPLAQLREQLPKALLEKLAGEITVSVEANPDEVLKEVLQVQEATEAREESEQVDALLTAALGHGPGVLGLEETLQAVVAGSVLTLVVEEDFAVSGSECPNCGMMVGKQTEHCPLCGSTMEVRFDIIEGAIERTLRQEARLESVHGPMKQRLAENGHIGALLRYNESTGTASASKLSG